MRVLKFLLVFLLLAAGAVFLVGYRLPVKHSASREKLYAYPPERLYQIISAPTDYPRWRTGVQRVDILPDSGGMKRFKEIALDGEVIYVVEEDVPNKLFVTRIAQAGLPYGGSWTLELTPGQSGTTLRITEDGEVYNPFFRFVSRYVMGHYRGIDGYMEDLEKRLAATG